MKALLIDPDKQSVSEIEIDNTLNAIYAAIGCRLFECPVEFPNGDTLYCDEEAWLTFKSRYEDSKLNGDTIPGTTGFAMEGTLYFPVLGRGLIIGTDKRGRNVDCASSVSDFNKIIWKSSNDMKKFGDEEAII